MWCAEVVWRWHILSVHADVTESFPGLPKQTELSEHFARQGFKLNTRKVGLVTSRSLPGSCRALMSWTEMLTRRNRTRGKLSPVRATRLYVDPVRQHPLKDRRRNLCNPTQEVATRDRIAAPCYKAGRHWAARMRRAVVDGRV
jgi:hypothetical protein